MNLTAAVIAASATLLAGGLAALASLIVTVLAKESKTSEFRQQWIDALREDVAALVSEVATFKMAGELYRPSLQSAEKKDFLEKYRGTIGHAFELMSRIELRLNPAEHGNLSSSIAGLMASLNAASHGGESRDLEDHVGRIVGEAQLVLKKEWERVKRGEPAFCWARKLALAMMALALAGLTYLVYRAAPVPAQAPVVSVAPEHARDASRPAEIC